MAFTKIRIAIENYVGRKTVFTPFVIVAGLTFAAVGTSLVLGGSTPGTPVTSTPAASTPSTSTPAATAPATSTPSTSTPSTSTPSSSWSSLSTYDLNATAKYVKDTCAKFNKKISDVEAKDVAELAQKLSIFATHAKSDITNGASDSTLAKNKEVIIDANNTDAAMDKGSKEVKSERDKNNISDILLDLSTDYKICKSLRIIGGTNGTVGDTVTFKAQCTPENAEVKYEYKSSDTKIATVSQDGKVKLLSAGNVTITVTDKNTGVSDSRTIQVSKKAEASSSTEKKTDNSSSKKTENSSGSSSQKTGDGGGSTSSQKTEESKPVTKQEVKATGVTLDYSSLSMTAGNSYELNAYVLWSNGTSSYQGITWTTSNNGVATVSSSGYVTARSAGTATITASYGSYSKSCTVTVKAASQPSSQPSGGGNGGNRGSTSKPSGGGSGSSESSKSSTSVSSMSLEEQARHYGFDLNVYDDARLHGVFWSQYGKSEGIDTKKVYPEKTFYKSSSARIKVKSNEGYEVYEVPELLTQVNKRRALKGLQPLTWQGYDATGVKEVRDWFNDPNNSDNVDTYKSEHPNWFKNGKITDDGIKAYFDEAATAACESIDACLRTRTLNHINGGSNVNGDLDYYNPERWIDVFEMSQAHWDALMDPDAEIFYALAAPNTVANNSSGDNGYLVCIWVG